jgi:hypothetical protein
MVHNEMDKLNSSIPRLVKKEMSISNVMNHPIPLTNMRTHGNKNRDFDHLSLSFLEMSSNFLMTSLAKCLKNVEELMVGRYGDFLYKMGTSNHPFHEVLL